MTARHLSGGGEGAFEQQSREVRRNSLVGSATAIAWTIFLRWQCLPELAGSATAFAWTRRRRQQQQRAC